MVILQSNIYFLNLSQIFSMKPLFSLFIVLILMSTSCSSPKNAPYLEEQFDKAISFNDNITAVYYLHELMGLDSENNSIYIRLGDLYSKMGNYKGSISAIEIALTKSNKLETKDLLFAKVRSYKGLNQKKEAIQVLDSLCILDKERELEYRYEIALLYFESKDLKNAVSRMSEVLKNPMSAQIKKELKSDLGKDKISYYLAALNFIGYIKIITGELEEAEQIYQEILKQTKDFKLANNNIKLLEQEKLRKAKSKVSDK